MSLECVTTKIIKMHLKFFLGLSPEVSSNWWGRPLSRKHQGFTNSEMKVQLLWLKEEKNTKIE